MFNGKLSSDKFIPEDYMWSTSEDRKYLLAGLLDSDGTIGNIQKTEQNILLDSDILLIQKN